MVALQKISKEGTAKTDAAATQLHRQSNERATVLRSLRNEPQTSENKRRAYEHKQRAPNVNVLQRRPSPMKSAPNPG